MFRSKAKDEYIHTVEHCVANQDYIVETATMFIEVLSEERSIVINEGRRVKDKSNKFIELIGDDSSSSTDFASSSKIFAKFFEIVGHLVSQNYQTNDQQTDYDTLKKLIEDLKDFNKEVNKSVIVEKLKTLNKMRTNLGKKEDLYQKATNAAEEVVMKFKEVRNDPTLDYELSVKETAKEKANGALKNLEDRRSELQAYINQVNEHQKG